MNCLVEHGGVTDHQIVVEGFTAVIAMEMLKGCPLERINEHTNRVAPHVCSSKGVMVTLPEELRKF